MSDITLPTPINRTVFLNKQVNQDSIGEIIELITSVNESDASMAPLFSYHGLDYTPKPITIYIDSYGGSVYQCFGLLSVMQSSVVPVNTIVTGTAMSAGFMIAIAGKHRSCYSMSTFLYHQLSSGSYGKLATMEEDFIENQRLQRMIEDHVYECTDITKKRLRESYKNREDWFIPAEDALELGCVDEIIEG